MNQWTRTYRVRQKQTHFFAGLKLTNTQIEGGKNVRWTQLTNCRRCNNAGSMAGISIGNKRYWTSTLSIARRQQRGFSAYLGLYISLFCYPRPFQHTSIKRVPHSRRTPEICHSLSTNRCLLLHNLCALIVAAKQQAHLINILIHLQCAEHSHKPCWSNWL